MRLPRTVLTAAALVTAAAFAGCGSSTGGRAPTTSRSPAFTTRIDNQWMPLKPGTTLIYQGAGDSAGQRDVLRVTSKTKVVDGVRCVVIDDRVYAHGHVSERTSDYYAEDRHGSVWYFGEDTAELNARGKATSTAGTWHAGINGARAGLFMPAHPQVDEHHYQEYSRGQAEDQYRVIALRAHVQVPHGRYDDALLTHEWTTLEPKVLDAKYYVRGIGEVYEGSLRGGNEIFKLVAVRRDAISPRDVPR